jgi:hypothetical protein
MRPDVPPLNDERELLLYRSSLACLRVPQNIRCKEPAQGQRKRPESSVQYSACCGYNLLLPALDLLPHLSDLSDHSTNFTPDFFQRLLSAAEMEKLYHQEHADWVRFLTRHVRRDHGTGGSTSHVMGPCARRWPLPKYIQRYHELHDELPG